LELIAAKSKKGKPAKGARGGKMRKAA
jgi:hypothetical protein